MAARSVGISSSAVHHPSDEEIIKFITDNISNEDLLTDYFLKLKKPLTPDILTLKFPVGDNGEVYNLLGYAGCNKTKYLKYIVQLATPEAIDSALLEDPANDVSGTALHAILIEQAKHKQEGIIELIQKASRETLSTVLVKQYQNLTPLFLGLQAAEENIACELIKKANDDSINHVARLMSFGFNILESFIHLENCSQTTINTFLKRLRPETMNFLMSMTNRMGMTPFLQLIVISIAKSKERNDDLFCSFVSYTSSETLNTLAKEKCPIGRGRIISVDLLTLLVFGKRTQRVVDAILSRLNKEVLHELALNGGILGMSSIFFAGTDDHTNLFGLPPSDITKTTDATTLAVVRHFDKETLIALMNQPINISATINPLRTIAKEEGEKLPSGLLTKLTAAISSEMTSDFLNNLSKNNAPMFNEFVRKMLLDGDRVDLSTKAIYRLDAHNLSRYLAQHPEISVDELKQVKAYSRAVNWKYKKGFNARLLEAKSLHDREINFSLSVYHFLLDPHLIETPLLAPLALIVMGYFERDKSIIDRFNYEMAKEYHPTEAAELKSTYPLVKERFKRDEELSYKHNEAKLVLEYLADHQHMANVAMADFKKENPKFEMTPKKKKKKMESKEEKKEAAPSKRKFSLFGSKKPPENKLGPYQLKINNAQKELADYVMEQNKNLEEKVKDSKSPSTGPKTLTELKKLYELKENKSALAKIAELEKKVGQAHHDYQETCVKLVIQGWDSKKTKSESIFSRKKTQAQLLQAVARQYGYECKNMPPDGNCFFRAIAHQLSIQKLSHLGMSHGALRDRAIAHIITNLNEYKGFLDEHDGSINDFINKNLDTGTWADHLVILALSQALNINIVVIRSDGAPPNLFRQAAPITTVYVGYEVERHYQSLVENRSFTRARDLQSDAIPVDRLQGASATASTVCGFR